MNKMYQINEATYHNLLKMVQVLINSQQNMISCLHLNMLNDSLNKAVLIEPEKEVKNEE